MRDYEVPQYLDTIEQFSPESVSEPDDYADTLLSLLSSPTIAGKEWIYRQYDHMVQTNTAVPPGNDAAVLRLRGTGKMLAITADCNGAYCYLDPYQGAVIAVAEAARNLAVAGAKPLAITNCLNFGNPTKPGIFWQFKECIRGMDDACRALNTPVTGGNVSFYNEYDGTAVYPTPLIGMVGVIESIDHVRRTGFTAAHDTILLVEPADIPLHLGGSHYISYLHKSIVGPCPEIDAARANDLVTVLLDLIRGGYIHSAHDISEGGLAVALSECVMRSPEKYGALITLPGRARPDIELFSEAQSRVILAVAEEDAATVQEKCAKKGFTATILGDTVPDHRLTIDPFIDISYQEMIHSFEKYPWDTT